MIDDERLAGGLRAMLARRDPGGAPAHLEVAILERFRAENARPRFGALRWVAPAASATAVVLIVGTLIAIGSVRTPTPAATPSPSVAPSAFALAPGDGVVSGEFLPVLQILVWLVAVAGCAGLVLRSRVRWLTIGGTLGLVGLAWLVLNAGTSDAVVDTGMVGLVDPYTDAAVTEHQLLVGVTGDEPFRTILVLSNTSRVPLTLRGLVPTPFFSGYAPPIAPRFVALGRLPDDEYTFDHVAPFTPVVVQPGGLVNVEVLGMAGVCAIEPLGDRFSYGGLGSITLVYEQLTLVHTAEVRLAREIQVPQSDSCVGKPNAVPSSTSTP